MRKKVLNGLTCCNCWMAYILCNCFSLFYCNSFYYLYLFICRFSTPEYAILLFLFIVEYCLMDTPQSPCQSPQSPEEEEDRALSDSRLLESSEEDDRLISDSEMVQAEENDALIEEGNEDGDSIGRDSALEEEREGEDDEVVPDFVSDSDNDEPVDDGEGLEQEEGSIMFVEGDEDCGERAERERDEQEDEVADGPQSPDSDTEQDQDLFAKKEREDRTGTYGAFQKEAEAEADADEDKSKAEDEDEGRRRVIAVREMKDDSSSVTRELDEHELDYDEEVPDESSIPAHEEEDDEEETKGDGEEEEESEEKLVKNKERKTIMPPSPKDGEIKRSEESKGSVRARRDSFRDKKKDEDDGEIDEGEIDVSVCCNHCSVIGLVKCLFDHFASQSVWFNYS